MRILNLILYSETDPIYTIMRDVLRGYLSTLKDVDYYFYCYSTNYSEPYVINGDTIYFNGKESYVPGILTKTIEALRLFYQREEYDYIVRTNISTICNFSLLKKYLGEHSQLEYGGAINGIGGFDYNCGITDSKYFGLNYVSGTCFIMKREALVRFFENIHRLNWNVIDDVGVGEVFRDIGVKCTYMNNVYRVNAINGDKTTIIYRNRNDADRKLDIINMGKILCDIMTS